MGLFADLLLSVSLYCILLTSEAAGPVRTISNEQRNDAH